MQVADLRSMLAGFVDEVAETQSSTMGRIQSLRTLALALRFGDDKTTASLVTLAAHLRTATIAVAVPGGTESGEQDSVASV